MKIYKTISMITIVVMLIMTSYHPSLAEGTVEKFLIKGKYFGQEIELPSVNSKIPNLILNNVEDKELWGSFLKDYIYNDNMVYLNWILKSFDYGSLPISDINVLGETVEYDQETGKIVGLKPEYRKLQDTKYDKLYRKIINNMPIIEGSDVEKVGYVLKYVDALNVQYNKKIDEIIKSGGSIKGLNPDDGNYIGIVKYGTTTCTGYTQLISDLVDKLGMTYRFVTVWVTDKPEELDTEIIGHIYLQVMIDGNWRDLDLTRKVRFRNVSPHPILKGIHIYSWGITNSNINKSLKPKIFFYK